MQRDQGDAKKWKPLVEYMLDSPQIPGTHGKRHISSLWIHLTHIIKGLRSLKGVPFTHFALPLPSNPSTEELHFTYKKLYDAAATSVRSYIKRHGDLKLHPTEGGASAISYNLALTTSGMVICPRRSEAATLRDSTGNEIGSVALNGTILAGTLMVKLEDEWNLLRDDVSQLDQVLETIGIPITEEPFGGAESAL